MKKRQVKILISIVNDKIKEVDHEIMEAYDRKKFSKTQKEILKKVFGEKYFKIDRMVEILRKRLADLRTIKSELETKLRK